jgi:hypothetical protein
LWNIKGLADGVAETAQRFNRRRPRRSQHHGAAAPDSAIGTKHSITANQNICGKKRKPLSKLLHLDKGLVIAQRTNLSLQASTNNRNIHLNRKAF